MRRTIANGDVLARRGDVDVPPDGLPTLSKTRVAIVEDHAMVAEGFARIIAAETDLECVGIASTLAEAMPLVEHTSPDVVLMDFHLPDGAHGDDLAARAIEAGCSGFLKKTRPASDIVTSIRAVARGELVVSANELAGVLERFRSGAVGGSLTAREREVLRHLAQGQSNEDIAKALYVSLHTVRNHVQNILTKLNAHSKLSAVAVAMRLGIIGLNEIG
jgi:two-component system, NarL family, nitrate/nitrite response regulator NarL